MDGVPDAAGLVAALHGDEADRVRLAAHVDTPAGTLRHLASDPAVTVRVAVALNTACSPGAHEVLAGDADARVRAFLATKMARLLPETPDETRSEMLVHVHRTLEHLARDAAEQVRVALAESLGATAGAPRALILALANDTLASVSEPVLRLSPLLTDEDLVGLLAAPPHARTGQAIARRTGLSPTVSDAIVLHGDVKTIAALLGNHSAAIREVTLDRLVGRAADHAEWHEPLVQRPWLPEQTARALSRIVTEQLVAALLARDDVPESLAREIRQRMSPPEAAESDQQGLARIKQLQDASPIRETNLMAAAAAADFREMRLLIATAGRVPLAWVDQAVATRNAKALVSLVWRAGFSMAAARSVQSHLAALSPEEVLGPAMHGAFPLCVQEMEWQIEQLATEAVQS